MTAADDIHKYFFHCFSEKIRLDISCFLLYWSNNNSLHVQSNLRMWSPLFRGYLSQIATFSGSLEPKYSANEPVLRDHLS